MAEHPPEIASDSVLLERFRSGDRAAFDEIVEAHRLAVYRVAWRILRSHEDADEAAQVMFVKAWRAIDRFRGDAALRTWLVRIALNVARSMRSTRRAAVPLDALGPVTDEGESSDESLRRDEDRRELRRAVDGLPPRQREVVVLKVLSEMTYREVATVMQLSEGAVKAHLHQAVSNLRRRLGAAGGKED